MRFKEDFEYFTKRIFYDKLPTAFARYADGERMLISGIDVGPGTQATDVDKWRSSGKNLFCFDLEKTLYNTDENYFYAISCSCCDPIGKSFYDFTIKQNKTFANLWINSNYLKFREVVNAIKEDVVFIGNSSGVNREFPFPIKKYFSIGDDIVNYYIQNKEFILNSLTEFCDFDNTLVLISAGPFSEIIIDHLWKINKTNRYIDIGSSLSDIVHGEKLRPYMKDSHYSNLVCV